MSGTASRPARADARRFKPYPKYKDSGVEWLGAIPAHWEVKPLKRALCPGSADGSLIKGRMHQEPGEGLFPGFSASGQDIWVEEAQHTKPGIVLSAVGARCGKTFKADGGWTAVANTHVIFPEAGYDRDFLWYLTNDETFWDRGGTAQPFVRLSSTLQRPWCFPNPDEQGAIASFLDREAAKIDALVAKKDRLIELLHEERTALITRAVTKGLDPNAPMKDSGVEWLGEIPGHWQLQRLKHVCERIFVGVAEAATFAYVDDGVPMLRSTDVRANHIRTDEIKHLDREFAARLSSKRLRIADIVTVRTGNAGVSALVPPEYDGGQCFTLVVSRPSVGYDGRYFCYWLNSPAGQHQFTVEGMGTAQVNISVPIVQNAAVCVPPHAEQRQVADWIEQELARVDPLTARVRDAIGHLRELRAALISAAVTGKIDVRGADAV